MSRPDPFDARVVMAEVRDEVRRRREAGEVPPGYEHELDLAFARIAPPGAVGDDLDAVIERAERASHIDVDVPTESARPGLSVAKSGLRKVMAWYLRYLAQQTSAFASVSTKGLRLLADRIEAVEAATPGVSRRVADELDLIDLEDDSTQWTELAVAQTDGLTGRVLVAEAGAGGLLGALVAGGRDAYGVEPRRRLADRAAAAGLEVRPDDVLEHLRLVPVGALDAVVLTGFVDRRPVPELLELADLAASRVTGDGVVMVLSRDQAAVASDPRAAVAADLAPGRSLRADTWVHLFAVRGLGSTEVVAGSAGTYAVVAWAGRGAPSR